jgi:hypothetical protein
MDAKTPRIRALNDELRQHLTGGMAVITPGVAALGPEAVERIVKTIAVFDDFCHASVAPRMLIAERRSVKIDPYVRLPWSIVNRYGDGSCPSSHVSENEVSFA